MKKFLYSLISVWFCLGSTVLSQNPEWITYNTSNSGLPSNEVRSITIDGSGNKWIGTNDGLAKFDNTKWTVYNTSNSGLPSNWVLSLAIDGSGNKWIGTYDGKLAKFDDTTWTVYDTPSPSPTGLGFILCITIDNTGNKWIGVECGEVFTWGGLIKYDDETFTFYDAESDSGVPLRGVTCIAIDEFDNKWIGIYDGGLAKFDDTNWTVYNTNNSGLPSGEVRSLAIDGNGNKWIGTVYGGLAKFDGTNWTVYNTSNSGLPANDVSSITIDGSGNKWIGTFTYSGSGGGMAKFDGTNWTVYNTSNSGLPNNSISSLAIDQSGNKWIGSDGGGLGVYKEGGVVVPVELNSFTAEALNQKVILKWTTATELNNNGFEIQRRVAESEFATIGFVKGEGTTTNQKEYSYIDKDLADGKYFYRLKQIDYNGVYEYSEVIEVDIRSLNEYTLEQNYPNPFNPATTIGYVLKEKTNAKLILLNAIGEEVAVLVNEEQDKGFHKIDFDAGSLSSGVYFYQLKAGDFIQTKKMLLLK